MVANTPFLLPKRIQQELVRYTKACQELANKNYEVRSTLEHIDRLYQREMDFTKDNISSKSKNNAGDTRYLRNMQVPIVMPQVETAVAYQTAVFLTGHPLFGVVSSEKYMDAALQMETIIDNQSVKGKWTRELLLFFRDGFKYNLSAVEVAWSREVTPELTTDLTSPSGVEVTKTLWEGNTIKRLDLYNVIADTRVLPYDIPAKGEFAGYLEYMSRTALKDFIGKLPDKMVSNVRAAFESSTPSSMYYVPTINDSALVSGNHTKNEVNWASLLSGEPSYTGIKYSDGYVVKTLYARIIPSDFGMIVPEVNTPQVWKFIVVNESELIYAERQTNAHNLIPIFFGCPHEDGLGYQTKSLATNVEDVQAVTSSLLTSVLDSRRRAVSDRTLYDPSRIREADINSPNPSAKIPVRPSVYGKNLGEAVYPFPFNDDQSSVILQQLPLFSKFADIITGQNQASQGQFVKGNKTLHEYSDVMSRANGRQQTVSILYEAQVFTPIKEVIKLNILQYQGGTTLYNRDQAELVTIDPVTLRKATLEFKISDGLIPSEKLINGESFSVAMQVLGSSPQIAQGYNVAKLFSYLMKTQGANIKEFEKPAAQVQYEQAISQWQQTIMQIFKDNPEVQQNQLPPQPTPEQFGLNKDGTEATNNKQKREPTLIEQVMAIEKQEGETNDTD